MFSRKLVFLFGVTPADFGASIYGIAGVNKKMWHAHNLWLQTGVSFGFPAMLGMVVFSGFVAVRSLRVCFRRRGNPFPGIWMIPVILLCLLAEDVTEMYLLFTSLGPASPVFDLLLGWVVELDRGSAAQPPMKPCSGNEAAEHNRSV